MKHKLAAGDQVKPVRTVSCVVVHPLCIQDIVHGDHVVVLTQCTTPDSAKLLHVSPDSEQQTQVYT